MRIENTNSVSPVMQLGMAQGTDATSKNLQNQIQMKEQELQKLSENDDMSVVLQIKGASI